MKRSEVEAELYGFAKIARERKEATKTPAHFEQVMRPVVDAVIANLGIEVEYECDICNDMGYTTIPAHQHGGDIVDDQDTPCICQHGGDVDIDRDE